MENYDTSTNISRKKNSQIDSYFSKFLTDTMPFNIFKKIIKDESEIGLHYKNLINEQCPDLLGNFLLISIIFNKFSI